MEAKKLALLCKKHAEDKKAENIVVLNMKNLSSITDFFVIVSATSEPHMRAITDEIIEKIREDHEVRPRAIDGAQRGSWMVIDYEDVIVHVMRSDARTRYDLESLWGDAPRIKGRKVKEPKAAAETGTEVAPKKAPVKRVRKPRAKTAKAE